MLAAGTQPRADQWRVASEWGPRMLDSDLLWQRCVSEA